MENIKLIKKALRMKDELVSIGYLDSHNYLRIDKYIKDCNYDKINEFLEYGNNQMLINELYEAKHMLLKTSRHIKKMHRTIKENEDMLEQFKDRYKQLKEVTDDIDESDYEDFGRVIADRSKIINEHHELIGMVYEKLETLKELHMEEVIRTSNYEQFQYNSPTTDEEYDKDIEAMHKFIGYVDVYLNY
jgi:hypothetical protein